MGEDAEKSVADTFFVGAYDKLYIDKEYTAGVRFVFINFYYFVFIIFFSATHLYSSFDKKHFAGFPAEMYNNLRKFPDDRLFDNDGSVGSLNRDRGRKYDINIDCKDDVTGMENYAIGSDEMLKWNTLVK